MECHTYVVVCDEIKKKREQTNGDKGKKKITYKYRPTGVKNSNKHTEKKKFAEFIVHILSLNFGLRSNICKR